MTVSAHIRWGRQFAVAGLPIAFLLPLALPAGADDTARFQLDGVLQPAHRSVDGRFEIAGKAAFTPERSTANGRFTLKTTNAPAGGGQCQSDLIWRHGFEPTIDP
jgi:hypothetical protein